MAIKCKSCNCDLEAGSTFCQNCGTSVGVNSMPAQGAQGDVMGNIERNVYFRVARAFSWILLVFAILGFLYSVFLAIGSIGDLWGGKQSVSKEEVQAAISAGKGNANKTQNIADDGRESDPKLIGEYETELARLVMLFPKEQRGQRGVPEDQWDDRMRESFKRLFSNYSNNKMDQLAMTREAQDLLGKFEEKDMGDALLAFVELKQQKKQLALEKQIEAKAKFTYLGGAALMTAMLITLVSMVLVLLTIERNTRTNK